MRGKAIVKFRATDKKKNEKLDSKASQQRGKRGRKLGVNALTRKYYLRYNFETSKMRERAESSKNRRMDSNTEGSAPWSLNRSQMETYIHGRASHFQRGIQDFSLRDSIEAAMTQGCQELVATAKMRMQSEKATYDEIRKMGDTFGDQHNMSFLQYITSDTPSKQLNAIKDMLQILTLYEDIYVVTDEKKSDRAAGTVQVGLHMRGHNKNV